MAHDWLEASDEGKRAPDHMPREAGPWQRGEMKVGQACPEKPLLGDIRSHQAGHWPECPLSTFPDTLLKMPPLQKHTMYSTGSSDT